MIGIELFGRVWIVNASLHKFVTKTLPLIALLFASYLIYSIFTNLTGLKISPYFKQLNQQSAIIKTIENPSYYVTVLNSVAGDKVKAWRLFEVVKETYKVSDDTAGMIIKGAFDNANAFGFSPELLLAVMATESGFNPTAGNTFGAMGLMQVVPRYHPAEINDIGGTVNLANPYLNIYTGTRILSKYRDIAGGDIRKTLALYNGSFKSKVSLPSNKYANKVIKLTQFFKAEQDPKS